MLQGVAVGAVARAQGRGQEVQEGPVRLHRLAAVLQQQGRHLRMPLRVRLQGDGLQLF